MDFKFSPLIGSAEMSPDPSVSTAEQSNFQTTAKWGKSVLDRGFTIVPNLLLTQQEVLGLGSHQCLLLIHLMTYWWESGRNPYPSKAVLARRMGVSERQIQRYISDLIKTGFVRRRREDVRTRTGRSAVSFDLTGLVEKLQKLEGSGIRATPAATPL